MWIKKKYLFEFYFFLKFDDDFLALIIIAQKKVLDGIFFIG